MRNPVSCAWGTMRGVLRRNDRSRNTRGDWLKQGTSRYRLVPSILTDSVLDFAHQLLLHLFINDDISLRHRQRGVTRERLHFTE